MLRRFAAARSACGVSAMVLASAVGCSGDDDSASAGPGGGGQTGSTAWTEPVVISGSESREPKGILAAMLENGDVIVTYALEDVRSVDVNDVVATRYDAALEKWEAGVVLDHTDGRAIEPCLGSNRKDRVVVAWVEEYLAGARSLFASRYQAGKGWPAAPEAVSPTDQDQLTCGASIDGAGNAIVVHQETNRPTATRFDATSAAWLSPTPLSNETTSSSTGLVAHDARGNAVIVWSQVAEGGAGPSAAIHFRYFDSGSGAFTPLEKINPSGAAHAHQPGVALSSDGRAGALWHEECDASGSCVTGSVRSASGQWSSPARLGTGKPALYTHPSVGADASGNLHAAWGVADEEAGLVEVWTARSPAGAGTWSEPARLHSLEDADGVRGAPSVNLTVVEDGSAMVTWSNLGAAVLVARYDPAGGWKPAETLITAQGAIDTVPQIVANASGRIAVVWVRGVASGRVHASFRQR